MPPRYVLFLLLLAGCARSPAVGGSAAPPGEGQGPGTLPAATAPAPSAVLGQGLVAWESNRSGAFRIHLLDLPAGGEGRQLSPDEPGRDHCCPLLSPDGSLLLYLSLPAGQAGYRDGTAAGELRLVRLTDGRAEVLAPAARTYQEHRAAIWWGERELVFIDGAGWTVRLDLATGDRERLVAEPRAEFGWLVDPSGRWATTGDPTFSPFDRQTGRIETAPRLGGCQPVFSHDGRFGVWSAGAGGPIARLDLATRAQATLLARGDPRVPDGFGYLSFPMPSRDGAALAFAASRGEHDHFAADYEVFAVPTDPATLAPLGPAVRLTSDPAVDRFPDVWLAPLPLGRQSGEAPFLARLVAPASGPWLWGLGDGSRAEGERVEHWYREPGDFGVVARRAGRELRGRVIVRPPASERPEAPVPSGWPVTEAGLRFLWPDGDSIGRGWREDGPLAGADLLTPEGPAWLDATGRMALAGGRFVLAPELAGALDDALQATNELTLELAIEAWTVVPGTRGPIVSLANAPASRSFALWQEGDRLLLYLRTAETGPAGEPPIEVGRLTAGRPVRLAVTFTPGRLASAVDGRPSVVDRLTPGDFFHWRAVHFAVGDEERGTERWRGWVDSVRIASRSESLEDLATSDRQRRRERPLPSPAGLAEVRLLATSDPPELAAISPYREALLVQEFEVERLLAGELPAGRIRVARWAWLDGERQPPAAARPGERLTLRLRPFADEPRAQSLYLADTLPEEWTVPLYLDVGLDLRSGAGGE